MYSVKVEKDSISPLGHRLTSFVIQFPRVVLAEVVTHRVNSDSWNDDVSMCERTTTPDISKNSASSRAIPIEKMIQKITDDPYMPKWTLAQKGMQGTHTEDDAVIFSANQTWLWLRDRAIEATRHLMGMGIHKQDANRCLEQWAWVTQIVTSSRWDNYFALRCHAAAHPAFQRVARMMFLARRKSKPRHLDYGQWHLPFIKDEEEVGLMWSPSYLAEPWQDEMPDLIKHSAARCAWLSYENHEKDGSPQALLNTWGRLLAEVPKHASPVEHQATPMHIGWHASYPNLRSNLPGWLQARKLVQHEEVTDYLPSQFEIDTWGMKELE